MSEVRIEHVASTVEGDYEAELWCEFDCVAYVFVGNDPDELSERIRRASAGEETWDYVRPLSSNERYGYYDLTDEYPQLQLAQ